MEQKIKVGFLTERMLLGFGVDLVIHKTAQELVENGFDVTVFCLRTDGTYEDESYELVHLQADLFKNPLRTERHIAHLLRRLDYEDIDVWITQTYPFFIAPRILTNPVIVVDHGVISTEGFSLLRKLPFWYMHIVQNYLYFPKAARIVNISTFTQSLTPKLLRKNQVVIYNGANHYQTDVSAESAQRFREKHGIGKDQKLLLYVGRLNHKEQPYKNTDGLLRIYKNAKKKNNDIILAMAGYGSEADEKYLRSYDVKVFRAAPVETLSLLYGAADVYVSATQWEGFNLPLIESGLYKTPCVVFDIPAHREVLSQNPIAKIVTTEQEFADAVVELCEDDVLREKSAATAYTNAKNFTWQKTGSAYAKLVSNIYTKHEADIKKNRLTYTKGLVDIITLNYNGKEFLDSLFNSLKNQTYKNIRVTMVDNGSHDDSVSYVKEKYPWVNIIESQKNLFFSKGNNLAVSQTTGEYIYFVNNDCVVDKNAIKNFVDMIKRKGSLTAALAGKILFESTHDKKIIDAVGTVITDTGALFNRGIGQVDIGQYDQEKEVFGACFGSVFLPRKMYEKIIGPLDNAYFGYFEDVDWCYRARIMGYKIFYCPTAVAHHAHSGTTKKKDYNWKYYYIHRNFIRTMVKNLSWRKAFWRTFYKIGGLLHHFVSTKEPGRRFTVIRILWNTLYYSPVLLIKRWKTQRGRCMGDDVCFNFAKNEIAALNPVTYEPIFALETLRAMFTRLDIISKHKDEKIQDIVKKITYFNHIKKFSQSDQWDAQVKEMINEDIRPFIGARHADAFVENIVEKKTWKEDSFPFS